MIFEDIDAWLKCSISYVARSSLFDFRTEKRRVRIHDVKTGVTFDVTTKDPVAISLYPVGLFPPGHGVEILYRYSDKEIEEAGCLSDTLILYRELAYQ